MAYQDVNVKRRIAGGTADEDEEEKKNKQTKQERVKERKK